MAGGGSGKAKMGEDEWAETSEEEDCEVRAPVTDDVPKE